MAYNNILIPIDGSEPGFRALRKGVKMAKQAGARATALYVIPKMREVIEVFSMSNIKDAFRQEGENVLGKAGDMAKAMDFSISVLTEEGIPYERIIETARTLNCDLIVMGRHGHSAPEKFFVGSCTQRVLAGAPCPVLVVKEP